ncbi:MAG: hypothetical protein AB1331_07105 [Bacillota bacterium]
MYLIPYGKGRTATAAWPLARSFSTPVASGPAIIAQAGFDEDRLYLTVTVTGPWGSDGDRSWRYGDGLQVTISPETGPVASRYYTFGFSLTAGEPQRILVNRDGKWLLAREIPGTALEVEPIANGAVYRISIDWETIPPLHGLIRQEIGLNITYTGLVEGENLYYQLVEDEHFDTELTNERRVAACRLGLVDPTELVIRSCRNRTHGGDGDDCDIRVAVWTPEPLRATVTLLARLGSEAISVHTKPMQFQPGLRVFSHPWRSGSLPGGPYSLELRVKIQGEQVYRQDYPFFKLRAADLQTLKERFRQAAAGPGAACAGSHPTIEARFDWLEQGRAALGPLEDPEGLRETWEELKTMVGELAAGSDPLAGTVGYQRRAFRSSIDGTLQPYSVFIPGRLPGKEVPLLVMLHGSGVDEVRTARNPLLQAHLEERGWLLCAPQGRDLSGWYLGKNGLDVLEAIEACQRTLPVDAERIVLGGFSMGGFGTWLLGLAHRPRFRGLVVMSGRPDYPMDDSPEADPRCHLGQAEGLDIMVVHGDADRACPVEATRDFVQEVREHGARVTYVELPGAAHGNYDAWPEVFRWLDGLLGEG